MKIEAVPYVIETDRFVIELRFTAKNSGDIGHLMRAKAKAVKRLQRFAMRVWKLKQEEVKPCGCSGS